MRLLLAIFLASCIIGYVMGAGVTFRLLVRPPKENGGCGQKDIL